MRCLLFFFFQAEDGIRDLTVTGVQTCALPICTPKACSKRWPACARRTLTRSWWAATWRRRRARGRWSSAAWRSEEHTSELQSQSNLVCRLLLEKKKNKHRVAASRRYRIHDDSN